jgi:hypothetical protein
MDESTPEVEEGEAAVADPSVDVGEYLKGVDKVRIIKIITAIFFRASFNSRFDQPVDGLAFGIRHKKARTEFSVRAFGEGGN